MNKIRATNVVKDELAEEHQQLVSEMRALSRELRNFVEEMQRVISFTTRLRQWSGTDSVN